MNITYQCEHCRAWSTVRDNKVGTKVPCRDCGHVMTVPDTPDHFDSLAGDFKDSAPTPRPSTTSIASSPADSASSLRLSDPESHWGKLLSSGMGLVIFVVFLALRLGLLNPNNGVRPPRPQRPPGVAVGGPGRMFPQLQPPPVKVDLNTPIEIPKNFPPIGRPRDKVPGVVHFEIHLDPDRNVAPSLPGHAGTFWLYLPENPAAEPRSLGCVLIAPSGSNSISGMKLSPADRVEHIPYVKAGFAVLAFDIDGADLRRRRSFPSPEFLRARAGLANAKIAIEYLKTRVPQVDPNRIYIAGHGSAGTLALLFAEHEPSIKACLTYAPIVDLIDHLRKDGFDQLLTLNGYAEQFRLLSPTTEEANLKCPLFLFNARDNHRVDSSLTVDFADRLIAMRKPVTLEIADSGGDIQSMLDTGIPHGIKWLAKIDAELKSKK